MHPWGDPASDQISYHWCAALQSGVALQHMYDVAYSMPAMAVFAEL